MTPLGLTLRSEDPQDTDFLSGLFAADAGALLRDAGLPEVAVAHLVAMQWRARDASYRAAYQNARFRVAAYGGVSVGRIVEADVPGFVHVVDIAVDPFWRRQGIATAILLHAIRGWTARGCGGRANILASNAASLALFKRAGFTVQVQGGATQFAVIRPPPS